MFPYNSPASYWCLFQDWYGRKLLLSFTPIVSAPGGGGTRIQVLYTCVTRGFQNIPSNILLCDLQLLSDNKIWTILFQQVWWVPIYFRTWVLFIIIYDSFFDLILWTKILLKTILYYIKFGNRAKVMILDKAQHLQSMCLFLRFFFLW